MKLINKMLLSIGILFSPFSYGMEEPAFPKEKSYLIVKNASTWNIQITYPISYTLGANTKYTFTEIPPKIVFQSYGVVLGAVARSYTVDIQKLISEQGLSQIPPDYDGILTISTTGWTQQWTYSLQIQRKSETARETQAELSTLTRTIDIFPKMRGKKSFNIIHDARYILGLPATFNEQELEANYVNELNRLNRLKREVPRQEGVINNALSILDQAKKFLEEKYFKKYSPQEIDALIDEFLEMAEEERIEKQPQPIEIQPIPEAPPQPSITEQEKKEAEQAIMQSISKEEVARRQKNAKAFASSVKNQLNQAGLSFANMISLRGPTLDLIPTDELIPFFKGKVSGGDRSLTLKDYFEANDPAILEKLVNEYKIHLMPADNDIVRATKTLIEHIKRDTNLQEAIGFIKIKAYPEELVEVFKFKHSKEPYPKSEGWRTPKIVIYVGGGKQKAQLVLDKIYNIFNGWPGLGRAPIFNNRVTDFIFFAHGNRTDKVKYPTYFEQPEMIYYRSDITGKDVTGTEKDYRLQNPSQRQ